MNRLRVTSGANRDYLAAIKNLYDQGNGKEDDFVNKADAAYRRISLHPRQFGRLEFQNEQREIRRLLLERLPYMIIYEMINDDPVVIAIAHTSLPPETWLHGS